MCVPMHIRLDGSYLVRNMLVGTCLNKVLHNCKMAFQRGRIKRCVLVLLKY